MDLGEYERDWMLDAKDESIRLELEQLDQLNREREVQGLPPLKYSDT